MANDAAILAVDEDIDDQIEQFCAQNGRIQVEDVLRDIARIACIVRLVDNGTLDGRTTVLCGGMAMRCLDSPRLSIYDGDTASRVPEGDLRGMASNISFDDDDIAIRAQRWHRGDDLVTFRPVEFDARFSTLAGAREQFSLSVSFRGVELREEEATLNHRYPFTVLARPVRVPIMHRDEILAEKITAWWLFGHAKHYNDIAFLATLMAVQERDRDPDVRRTVRRVVEQKIEKNATVHPQRVQALTGPVRQDRLANPDDFVDEKRNFNTLSYLTGKQPSTQTLRSGVQRIVLPLLFDS